MSDQSRREFMKLLSAIAASGLAGTVTETWAHDEKAAGAPGYKVLPWKGDDFTFGHRLRDGDLPKFPDKADSKADFVIVGGGMAGLSTAHFLKGQDILLLEQYEHTGGTAQGGSYRGIDYSMGAVCTGSHDGIYAQLFDDLKIKPAVIPPDQIAWHCDKRWYKGIHGEDAFYKELNRLTKEMQGLVAKLNDGSAEEKAALKQKLETTTFDKYLETYNKDFVKLIANIANSFYCAGPDFISAMSGIDMINILSTNSYVFEGGNSGIAKALRRSVNNDSPGRCKPSSFVWRVEPRDKGASVVYSDKEGAIHRVDCRHAVVTTPPMVALRIVPQMPQAMRDRMQQLEYSAFLVANFCMKKKVFNNPYQSFADQPFPFGQMILAETPYQVLGKYHPDMGSVLTVYHPFEHGTAGRVQMLGEDREKLAESMVSQLNQLIENFQGSLEQVVLTRWGHAFNVPKLGAADLMYNIQELDPEWMTFANCSAKGGSFEGAVQAAHAAAKRCLSLKKA